MKPEDSLVNPYATTRPRVGWLALHQRPAAPIDNSPLSAPWGQVAVNRHFYAAALLLSYIPHDGWWAGLEPATTPLQVDNGIAFGPCRQVMRTVFLVLCQLSYHQP